MPPLKKTHNKTSEKVLNEMEINNLPNKEFKIMVIKMLTELGRKMMNIVRTSAKRYKI